MRLLFRSHLPLLLHHPYPAFAHAAVSATAPSACLNTRADDYNKCRTVGRYLSSEPVLTATTRSPAFSRPRSSSCGSAARQAAPSGLIHQRVSRHTRLNSAVVSASLTATAAPPLSRMICNTRKWPTPPGTFNPQANATPAVTAAVASAPDTKALNRGGEPTLVHAVTRGRMELVKTHS